MTYTEWGTDHLEKIDPILNELKGESISAIIDYFDYENMVKEQLDFCPLYRTYTKCHVTYKLNCLLCSCNHFQYSDHEPISVKPDGTKVMSICNIGSKQAQEFIVDGVSHCDCSKCCIPHTISHVKMLTKDIMDGYSLLEYIRNYQFNNVWQNAINKGKRKDNE